MDARHYDPRLRPPVHPAELAIDPLTGMKNYIANETGGWATSTGYVKHSLTRSIHFGRLYTSGGHGVAGREEDLCEALRCLGQSLHCLEDFSAHSNYIELTLRELGFHSVFPHTGVGTEVMAGLGAATPAQPGAPPYGGYAGGHPVHQQQPMGGGPMKRVFPLVTGTFGAVDFLHSVLGEAQDKFSQTEVDELDNVLGEAHEQQKKSERSGQKSVLQGLLQQIPNLGGLSGDADRLEAQSNAKEMENMHIAPQKSRGPAGAGAVPPSAGFDPVKTARDIYPILEFRDKVMRSIEEAIERIPGLSALVEKISDTLSLFVLSLLAPYVRPIIAQASLELKAGSSAVVDSSASHQFEPWTIPTCSDPTHSLLSKDHFSNKLNTPAGEVASAILAFAVPRIVYAWENPTTPVEMVLHDVTRVFHHPALRDPNAEVQTTMFNTVASWVERLHDKGASLNDVLSSEGVRAGKNHEGGVFAGGHGGGHGKTKSSEWDKAKKKKKDKDSKKDNYAGIPGISSSGGSVSVGGVKIPGPIGGIFDAVAAGYQDGGGGGSSSGKYKEEKYHDKEKKKEKKEKHYDEYDRYVFPPCLCSPVNDGRIANESSKTGTKKTKRTRIRTSTKIRIRRIRRTRKTRRIRSATLETRTLRTNVVTAGVVRSMGTMVGMGIRLGIRLGTRGDIRAGIKLSDRLVSRVGGIAALCV